MGIRDSRRAFTNAVAMIEAEHIEAVRLFAAFEACCGSVDEFEKHNLRKQLLRLFLMEQVVLAEAGLQAAASELARQWERVEGSNSQAAYWLLPEGFSVCPKLEILSPIFAVLQTVAGTAAESVETTEVRRLEALLRSLGNLVHRRACKPPEREEDVQEVMDHYFPIAFSDYIPKPQINGILRNYKADGGVRSVGALIELKFCQTEKRMRDAIAEILEDASGYQGSRDWRRHYAVFYMTDAFCLEQQIAADLRRAGAKSWTAFTVNGSGTNAGARGLSSDRTNKSLRTAKAKLPGR